MEKNKQKNVEAKSYEEIKPLVDLCNAGKLFDVQSWISEGKPVNLPCPCKPRKKSPLEIAIELGFHSLAQVLLEGGAAVEDSYYSPMSHALSKRRLDLVELLVNNGADIHNVGMEEVFETWNNEIVEYFIQRGADLVTGDPMASAFCSRIRTALAIFKRYEDHIPSFKEQVNIAFRYHCKEGNLKWVSLMLWAGADPYARGPDLPGETYDPDEDLCGLEYASIYRHFDIFKLKAINLDTNHHHSQMLFECACRDDNAELLKMLMEKGYDPMELEGKGSVLIQSLISSMTWEYGYFSLSRKNKNIDSSRSREKMKMLHMLVRHGARWEPEDKDNINWVRRSLLKMRPDYTMEFVWIMSEYKACKLSDIEELMRTLSIRSLISDDLDRYQELKEAFTT